MRLQLLYTLLVLTVVVFTFQVPTINTESSGEFGLDLDQEDVSDPAYQARVGGAIPGLS